MMRLTQQATSLLCCILLTGAPMAQAADTSFSSPLGISSSAANAATAPNDPMPGDPAASPTPTTSSAKSTSAALQPKAPPPERFASAHTVYLENVSSAADFPIDPDLAYQEIYTALQTWGRYQIVNTPDKADLIFELNDDSQITGYYTDSDNNSYAQKTPAFNLVITDPVTREQIWTISSPVYGNGRNKKPDHWVDISVTNLVSRIKVLSGTPLTPTETADLTTAPKSHAGLVAGIAVTSVLGIGVGAFFLMHHAFENAVAKQKADQDAFCEANHIPLNECAGG